MNIMKKKKKREEKGTNEDKNDQSSYHSPFLSSNENNVTNDNEVTLAPLPQELSTLKIDHMANTSQSEDNITPAPIVDNITTNIIQANSEPLIISISTNTIENDVSSVDTMIIKIKHDFELQMSRGNVQEMNMINKSNNAIIMKVILQTTHERDVLCMILNTLINEEKKAERSSKTSKRDYKSRNISHYFK